MKLTLINDFHDRSITLQPRNGRLSSGQTRKAWATLCGSQGCRCGGYAGERGPQHQADGSDVTLWPIEVEGRIPNFPEMEIGI